MKILLSLSVLIYTNAAFALTILDHHNHTYEVKGHWTSPDGSKDKWDGTITFAKVDKHTGTITESFKVATPGGVEEMSVELTIKHTALNHFSVWIAAAQVGSGYCFGPVCHFSYTTPAGISEETLHFKRRGFLGMMGSMQASDVSVAWAGHGAAPATLGE